MSWCFTHCHYGNLGCRLSKGDIQNYLWSKINILKVNSCTYFVKKHSSRNCVLKNEVSKKKCAPEVISLNEKKTESDDFWQKKMLIFGQKYNWLCIHSWKLDNPNCHNCHYLHFFQFSALSVWIIEMAYLYYSIF